VIKKVIFVLAFTFFESIISYLVCELLRILEKFVFLFDFLKNLYTIMNSAV